MRTIPSSHWLRVMAIASAVLACFITVVSPDPSPPLSFEALEQEDTAHPYFRPSDQVVSGSPTNNVAAYHRSPCPALNALANHGYLPRNGKNLTPAILKKAVMDVYNVDETLGQSFVGRLPPTLTLADLSVHNFVEHDASLVHDDLYFGYDPAVVNATLVKKILARTDPTTQRITKKCLASLRRDRENESAKTNPQYVFGSRQQAIAYAESALVVLAFGDYYKETISVDHARTFLLKEKIPETWTASPVPITLAKMLETGRQILSLVPSQSALASEF
ncbi:hypothetical protein Poli38472_011078 [Pythium oligandrum]|uniref:Heme haloperoxidase family profile domain-containing protein n=1 Tax=Pythium oligandrum TaxID=41045 RepID=A0A8K1CR50_PYTOL|nr:hypothetical protein Poli38472_011078 [Pythium oligandrum]|eukprot:TMW67458.1 hypothetical protein Poli38472_011078 [Pythium oligandrum]